MKLDSYRRKYNLSQEQLADKLECSPAFVSQLLNNKRGISVPTAKLYSARLGGEVSVNEFLGIVTPLERFKQRLLFYFKFVHRGKNLFSWGNPPKT